MTVPKSKKKSGHCRGKARYRDQKEALYALHLIQRHGEERDHTPKKCYYCETCQGWHLTKRTKP